MAPSISTLSENGKNLNSDQNRVFNLIITDVEKTNKTKPLVLFVCGPAGTGKSLLITHLVDIIGRQHVIVCATTAMAGKNVKAPTLHSVMRFYSTSSEKDDEDLLPEHPFLKLLIIDEISMCGGKLFARTERRMRQIMRNDNVFGGCTVVIFGDLLQIPPVPEKKGDPIDYIFESPLWKKHVQYEELEIVMRQENDPEFAEMLKRWRIGKYTQEDRIFLDQKARKCSQKSPDDVVSYFCDNYDRNKNVMLLAYTNPTVGLLNRKITYKLFKDYQLYDINKSTHVCGNGENVSTIQRQLMFQAAVNSRVVINKNINRNLVNGVIGLIHTINYFDNTVVSLELKTSENIFEVEPVKTSIIKDVKWILEFPMNPAYALTYHKAQGQTLDDVFLLTSNDLPPALFYVGASRVRTREGLHILNFDAVEAIRADSKCLEEYIKLRVSIGKSPLPM